MEEYSYIIDFIIRHEGGYVNDPDDPGGETKYGISKRSYPNLNIHNLTLEDAYRIYFDDYIQPIIRRLKPVIENTNTLTVKLILLSMADAAVQHGHKRAYIFLQKALNKLDNGRLGTLEVDGIIGKHTLRRLESCIKNELVFELVALYIHFRIDFYLYIVDHRSSSRKYLRGWIRRVNDLILYSSEYSTRYKLKL